ncbi:protein of unknown function [Ekhidna lutea]|uniref:DUF4271 domain-containing protein n=1 Tax=Ekhidna lutea TaxID=447679 RepID=A0A239FBQ4_EKHLU|nr:DUF4271 domain-containing protein [Ekhidna lutea]SNS53743.1 protein of unknown function [Ekhidna lutea]
MKNIVSLIFIVQTLLAFCQQDTVVVTDYTKVMVGTDVNGELFPITSLENVNQAGVFINGVPNGRIRICNPANLSIWVNGRLQDLIIGCEYYTSKDLFLSSKTDTLFLSFSSPHTLENLKCELVVFEDLLVIKDEISIQREVRNTMSEFVISSLIILTAFLGFILLKFPGRVSYLLEKAFTFKVSAYEFINTSFFGSSSMSLVAFYSLSLSFVAVYVNSLLGLNFFIYPTSFTEFIWSWLKIACGVFGLFIIKWLVISAVAALFRFRGLKNFQLFDFINFHTILLLPIMFFLVTDFIINTAAESWITDRMITLFPVGIILFVVWFTLKFVNNSPRKKLMIISYLCATEIIPVIIFLGWFYK